VLKRSLQDSWCPCNSPRFPFNLLSSLHYLVGKIVPVSIESPRSQRTIPLNFCHLPPHTHPPPTKFFFQDLSLQGPPSFPYFHPGGWGALGDALSSFSPVFLVVRMGIDWSRFVFSFSVGPRCSRCSLISPHALIFGSVLCFLRA